MGLWAKKYHHSVSNKALSEFVGRFTGKIALHVLDLSCLEQVPEEERQSALYYWACVLKAKTWKEVLAMTEQSESIKKAVVTLRELSEDEKIRQQCEARERYQMDWQSSMRTSREKGRAEGDAVRAHNLSAVSL